VVSNAIKFRAEAGRVDSQPLQRCDTRWHQAFAAGFFAWKAAAFKEYNRMAAPGKVNGQRRAGNPGTRDQ